MFAGIDTARDWPPGGMTTAKWLRLPPRPVLISDLIATQDGVYLEPLIEDQPSSHCGDPVPHVVVWQGRAYLEDGHHRAVRAALNGQHEITARIITLDRRHP